MGAEGSATWTLLLDTAERIIADRGYASVTSRQLAKEAGLSPQIVYFYFKAMDDLFEALFKRVAESLYQSLDEAGRSDNPMLAMWEIGCDPSRSKLMVELLCLSNHRKNLQSLIGEFGREYNRRQVIIIEKEMSRSASGPFAMPPSVIASVLENLAHGFAFGEGFNITSSGLARDLVTEFIRSKFRKD